MAGATPVIELRGVSKQFGGRTAVADLDLDVPAECCFGLLGPNGAGKTTTLRMIYGVVRPSAGSIRVFGIDLRDDPRAVRARLGVTLQENVLVEPLSPRDNLRIFGRYHRLREPALSQRVEAMLDLLELRSHADVPAAALSGGFKRRLAIAMSLMNDPDLLVLDEPTTGLDPAVRLALWSRVRWLRQRGKTVLVTTHYMEEAERLCDQVVILSEGRAVAAGPPAELIRSHAGREAVELDCEPADEARLLDGFDRGLRRLRSGSRLILFTDDAAPLVERIPADERAGRLVVRPANLEDVFLQLTGTSLEEGAPQ